MATHAAKAMTMTVGLVVASAIETSAVKALAMESRPRGGHGKPGLSNVDCRGPWIADLATDRVSEDWPFRCAANA